MTLYKNKYRIESARKPGWDYSTPGYYFITVCTYIRKCLFGNVVNEKMHLIGYIVQNEWDRSFVIRCELIRDEFVVMPNHFHGIVRLVPGCGPVETSGRTSLQKTVNVNHGITTTAIPNNPIPKLKKPANPKMATQY